MKCDRCGFEFEDDQTGCPFCETGSESCEGNEIKRLTLEDFKGRMKWYNFLVYFLLFAGAFFNLATAIQYIFGLHYGDTATANRVYAVFPGMKGLDLFLGVCSLLVSVFALITRFSLRRFRENAPTLITAYYLISPVLSFIYVLIGSLITDTSLFESNLTVSMVGGIVLVILNERYFNARKDLFVN